MDIRGTAIEDLKMTIKWLLVVFPQRIQQVNVCFVWKYVQSISLIPTLLPVFVPGSNDCKVKAAGTEA